MGGFAGFSDYQESLREDKYLWKALARRMAGRISHRGPDGSGESVSAHCAIGHVRSAIVDPGHGAQPMTIEREGHRFTIAYNGEIYNAEELRQELQEIGYSFESKCDTEVVLYAYLHYGMGCAEKLNGMFAFVVDDPVNQCTALVRDQLGVKPLFYTFLNGRLVFGSEMKALFEYPGVNPVIKREGLCELFGLGPARTQGNGVFHGIHELLPGHYAVFNREGFHASCYYTLKATPHLDNYEKTVEHVRELLDDIVSRQLKADVPACTFLSGGLDSSVLTALAAQKFKESGKQLSTYSFDFEGNDTYFSPTAFQPEQDEAWAQLVSRELGTDHKSLKCTNESLLSSLYDGVIARDLPGMADIDGSLIFFCRKVKENHDMVICGEGADEIFGGYPWFHRREMFDGTAFPWSNNLDMRTKLLKSEIARELYMDDYVNRRLQDTISQTPVLEGESDEERRIRTITYLNFKWFMTTLLDRQDRCSMANGLEVRVPFADTRIAEYVYNVPWDFKAPQGIPKGLLRDAAKGLLSDNIIYRKKSPFPKTHNPEYEALLKYRLAHILSDSLQPIHKILSKDVATGILSETSDYGKPWYGQLMAGPQLLAYLIQVNYWLLHYGVYLDI